MKRLANKLCLLTPLFLAASPLMASGDGPDWANFSYQLVNFVIFFGGLFYILKKPMIEFFVNRVKGIRDSLELAENSREEAKNRLDEIEGKMANLDAELADIGEQAKADLQKEEDKLLASTKLEAERILAQARSECENQQREAATALKAFLADLALSEAEKMVKTTMTEAERGKLFADFTERLGARS